MEKGVSFDQGETDFKKEGKDNDETRGRCTLSRSIQVGAFFFLPENDTSCI